MCPISRDHLFLSPFLVLVTLYHLMLPINQFGLVPCHYPFLVIPAVFILKYCWCLGALAFMLCILPLKFRRGGEGKSWELYPLEVHPVMSDSCAMVCLFQSRQTPGFYTSAFSPCAVSSDWPPGRFSTCVASSRPRN